MSKNQTVTLYIASNKKNTSYRKIKKWFDDNNVPYVEKNISHEKLTKEELYHIFSMTDDIMDILCKHGKVYKEVESMGVDFEEVTMTELLYIIERHAGVLKFPLSVSKDFMMTGFSAEEVDGFLTREQRRERFNIMLEDIRNNEDHTVISFSGNMSDYSKSNGKAS